MLLELPPDQRPSDALQKVDQAIQRVLTLTGITGGAEGSGGGGHTNKKRRRLVAGSSAPNPKCEEPWLARLANDDWYSTDVKV